MNKSDKLITKSDKIKIRDYLKTLLEFEINSKQKKELVYLIYKLDQ